MKGGTRSDGIVDGSGHLRVGELWSSIWLNLVRMNNWSSICGEQLVFGGLFSQDQVLGFEEVEMGEGVVVFQRRW